MEYNDFPILNDEEYKFLENKFSENISFNRDENIFYIFSDLSILFNATPLLIAKSNSFIREGLEMAKSELEKLVENFNSTFNLKINKNEIKEKNLFNFLKMLANLQKKLIFWHKFEQKEYFKQFSLNTINSVNEILLSLTTALENSNIQLYRFM